MSEKDYKRRVKAKAKDYKRKREREKKKNEKKKTTQGEEELWQTRKKWEKDKDKERVGLSIVADAKDMRDRWAKEEIERRKKETGKREIKGRKNKNKGDK
jgi:hypothetical protein